MNLGEVDRTLANTGHLGCLGCRGGHREVSSTNGVGLNPVVNAGNPCWSFHEIEGSVTSDEDDRRRTIADGRQTVPTERRDGVRLGHQVFHRVVASNLSELVGERTPSTASSHCGEVFFGRDSLIDDHPGLQRRQGDEVRVERGHRVRVELQGEDLVEIAERALAEAVDEGDVDVTLLEAHERFVERPGTIHLDVALRLRWPHTNGVEGGHEAERTTDQVVGRARANEPNVVLGDACLGEDLVHDRHEHLHFVGVGLGTDDVALRERHHGNGSVALLGCGDLAHRYSR